MPNWGCNKLNLILRLMSMDMQGNRTVLVGNLVLFNGMTRYYALKKNELMVENQFYNRIVMIRNLKMEIITSYLQALLSYELWKIAKGHLQYTQAEYDKMLAFVEVEIKSSKDLLAIETQRAKDELVLLRAQNDFKLANLKLNQLMQIENQTSFHVDTSYNFLFTDTSVFIQVNNLPEIMQKERVIEQAEYDVKMVSAAYFPSLSVRAGLGSGYSDSYFLTDPTSGLSYIPDFQSQLTQNMYQNLTFTLTVPIYNKYQTKINQAQNEVEVKKAELERDQLELEIRATISNLRFDLENSQLELNSAMKLLELAKLDFEQAEEQYKAGVINYIILLDKKDRLFAAQSNVIQSKYNYYFKGKLLQLYNE
jgi:outer membrane protein